MDKQHTKHHKKICEKVYEIEKKKLKDTLKSINKISLTTDLWKSTNQKLSIWF